MLQERGNKDTSPNFRSLYFPKLQVFIETFYRAQYKAGLLVDICGAPTWQPENSVTYRNLL